MQNQFLCGVNHCKSNEIHLDLYKSSAKRHTERETWGQVLYWIAQFSLVLDRTLLELCLTKCADFPNEKEHNWRHELHKYRRSFIIHVIFLCYYSLILKKINQKDVTDHLKLFML